MSLRSRLTSCFTPRPPALQPGLVSSLVALIVVVGATMGTAAHAQTPAFTIGNTTGQALSNPAFTLGFSFTANSAVNVSALGIFDDSLDGLVDSHQVGLFNSSGTLLTSGTVGSGTSGALVNQFRYVNVGPVTLTGGATYFVGAVYTTGGDRIVESGSSTVNNFVMDPRLTFGTSTFASGGTLAAPTTPFGTTGFFGPNFQISSVTAAVPEPGEWATGAAFAGVLALGMVRARRKQTGQVKHGDFVA